MDARSERETSLPTYQDYLEYAKRYQISLAEHMFVWRCHYYHWHMLRELSLIKTPCCQGWNVQWRRCQCTQFKGHVEVDSRAHDTNVIGPAFNIWTRELRITKVWY